MKEHKEVKSILKTDTNKSKPIKKKQIKFDIAENSEEKLSSKQIRDMQKRAKADVKKNSRNEGRRWHDDKEEPQGLKRGKFEESEIETLKQSLCHFIQENNLGSQGLQQLISENTMKTNRGAWSKISEVLPNRSVQSVHNFAKRHWHPSNHGGKWSSQEVAYLKKLVNSEGRKWKFIGEALGRTALNVRDKWKELGEEQHSQRDRVHWSVDEIYTLFRGIQASIPERFIFIQPNELPLMKQQAEQVKDESTYFNRTPNNQQDIDGKLELFLTRINLDIASKIQDNDINWTKISRQLEKKSRDDCRNFWANRIWINIQSSQQTDNYEEMEEENLIKQIILQGPERDSDIQFNMIANKHDENTNRSKYFQMKKLVMSRTFKNTSDVLLELKHFYKKQRKRRQMILKEKTEEAPGLLKYFKSKYE